MMSEYDKWLDDLNFLLAETTPDPTPEYPEFESEEAYLDWLEVVHQHDNSLVDSMGYGFFI